MPTPQEDESRDEFLNRCMGDEEAVNDYPDEDQRYAVCVSLWEQSMENNTGRALLFDNHAAALVENIRREEIDGRETLIVPVVALKEKILHCRNCDPSGEFIPAEEIVASYQGWEGRPITVDHPVDASGSPISANTRAALEQFAIGMFHNVEIKDDGAKLKGEMYIDVERTLKMEGGEEIIARFESDRLTEVSTGYFAMRRDEYGYFDEEPYGLVQHRIVPDHLAILLDDTGACSLDDGCGAPRVNKERGDEEMSKMSRDKRVQSVLGRLVQDVASIFSLAGDGEQSEEDRMDREQVIQTLAASDSVPFSAEELEGFDDDKLMSLGKLAGLDCCGGDAAQNEGGSDGGDDESAATGEESAEKSATATATATEEPAQNSDGSEEEDEDSPFTPEEIKGLKALLQNGADLQSVIEDAKATAKERDKRKKAIIAELKDNSRCMIKEPVLNRMDLEALEGVKESLQDSDYAGNGGPRNNAGSDDEATTIAPVPVILADDEGEED